MPSNPKQTYTPVTKEDGQVYTAADVNRLELGLKNSFDYTSTMLPQHTDNLTASEDPDTITTSGVYSVRIENYTGTKWPKANFFGSMFVAGKVYITQMLIGSSSQNDVVKGYFRRWVTSANKFSNWETFETNSNLINLLAGKVSKTGDQMTGDLLISKTASTAARIGVTNSNGTLYLVIGENRGLWDSVNNDLILYAGKNSNSWHLKGTAENITGIASVVNGGTGQSSFTTGTLLEGNGTNPILARTIHNIIKPSFLESSVNIPTINTIIHWNGAYNEDGNSNLCYSKYGNLGLSIKSIARDGNTFTATRMDNTIFTFTQRYPSIVSNSFEGLVPKIVSQNEALTSQDNDLVLAMNKSGTLGWYALPANAFKGANITVEAIQTSGTHIGTITVDGIETNLYAPVSAGDSGGDGTGSTVTVSAALTSGTQIGTITVDGQSTILYSPKVVEITTSEINAICV